MPLLGMPLDQKMPEIQFSSYLGQMAVNTLSIQVLSGTGNDHKPSLGAAVFLSGYSTYLFLVHIANQI